MRAGREGDLGPPFLRVEEASLGVWLAVLGSDGLVLAVAAALLAGSCRTLFSFLVAFIV